MQINPYLHFGGDCRQAFEFYAAALGGEIVMMSAYADAPPEARPPGDDTLIMHAELRIEGAALYASDAPPAYFQKMQGFTLALQFTDSDRAQAAYDALVEGGEVRMPLSETFWAHRFGMLVDKFGTPWMINHPKAM